MDREGGGWTVLADYDFEIDTCPGAWLQDTSEGVCRGKFTGGGARTATFDTYGVQWGEVLVEICLRQYASTDAFYQMGAEVSLEDHYLDGFSLTYGAAGDRKHLFSWALGLSNTARSIYACPDLGGAAPPEFLGGSWACESGNPSSGWIYAWYTPRFFEGSFQRIAVATRTRESIEGRIAADQSDDEDVGVCGFWLAVR